MSANISAFVNASRGDAVRLELDATGVHAKGSSAGGRAVEWVREGLGLRTQENQRTVQAFVSAMKQEYGTGIGDLAEAALTRELGGSAKPLSARLVQKTLADADLRASTVRHNEGLAHHYSQGGDASRMSGFTSAALGAMDATGASKEAFLSLYDPANPKLPRLQASIEDAILAAGKKGNGPLSRDDAHQIAQTKIADVFVKHAEMQAIENRMATGDFQRQVADTASSIGLPALATALADCNSRAGTEFLVQMGRVVNNADHFPIDAAEIDKRIEEVVLDVLCGEMLAGDHVSSMPRLPADSKLAATVVQTLCLLASRGPQAYKTAVETLLAAELPRLAAGDAAEVASARELRGNLKYDRVSNPQLKVSFLRMDRDNAVASARQFDTQVRGGGTDPMSVRDCAKSAHNSWKVALTCQSDIVAFHLRELGAPLTAQTRSEMAELGRKSPALAEAMRELGDLQQAHAVSQGADPEKPPLDWAAGRQQLAQLRVDARALVGDAEGNHLQALIAARMRGLTTDLLARAVEVLGPAPAPFAIVSLGSASRGEASPYSDVEFGILLDAPATPATTDYMVALSRLVQMQVVALGENGGNEMPVGFHWDGGANTPSDNPGAFIGTAEELVTANLRGDALGKPLAMYGLTMFCGPELLYGNMADGADFALVKDMQAKVAQHFDERPQPGGASVGEAMGRWAAAQGVDVARIHAAAVADKVDVKEVSRLPMLAVLGLALEHGVVVRDDGIALNSTLLRIQGLVEKGVLSREDANILEDATVAMGSARIAAHLHAGEGNDTVFLDPAKAGITYAEPGLRAVIQSLIPFAERVQRHGADPSQPF